MKTKEDLMKELIVALSLSTILPIYQEEIINKISSFSVEELEKMIFILDRLSQKESDYLTMVDNYLEFYRSLSGHLEEKMLQETIKIQEELRQELMDELKQGISN